MRQKKRAEDRFKDIIAKNFPNLGNQTSRSESAVPKGINLQRNTPRHIIIKMEKNQR